MYGIVLIYATTFDLKGRNFVNSIITNNPMKMIYLTPGGGFTIWNKNGNLKKECLCFTTTVLISLKC